MSRMSNFGKEANMCTLTAQDVPTKQYWVCSCKIYPRLNFPTFCTVFKDEIALR